MIGTASYLMRRSTGNEGCKDRHTCLYHQEVSYNSNTAFTVYDSQPSITFIYPQITISTQITAGWARQRTSLFSVRRSSTLSPLSDSQQISATGFYTVIRSVCCPSGGFRCKLNKSRTNSSVENTVIHDRSDNVSQLGPG